MDYVAARRLLRKLATPGAIERDATATRLKDALRAPSAADAVLQVAETALRPFAANYWTIVRRADIGGESLGELSTTLYLSVRTICRRRRIAIDAICQAIDTKLAPAHIRHERPALDALRLVGFAQNRFARRSVAGLLDAELAFAAAATLEETCIDAWVGLAHARYTLGSCLMRDAALAFAQARAALVRAEALEPDRADVRALRGCELQLACGDPRGAARAYADALDRDESDETALLGAMWLALDRRDSGGAKRYAELALVARPSSLDARASLGIALLAGGVPKAARDWLESVLAVEPEHFVARYYYAQALIALSEYERCIEHVATVPERERSIMVDVVDCYARALAGDTDQAWLRTRRERGTPAARSLYARAVAHASLGETNSALAELRRAIQEGESFVATLAWDPLLAGVRADPRFDSLLEQIAIKLPTPPRR